MLKITFYTLLALFVLTVNSILIFAAQTRGVFDAQPYWDVVVRESVLLDNGNLRVTADFTKGDCELVKFAIRGYGLGAARTMDVEWIDLTGRNDNEDRIAGTHTLHGDVAIAGLNIDTIEVWTRHMCPDGHDENGVTIWRKVDKLFTKLEIPPP